MTDNLPATLPRAMTPAKQNHVLNIVRRAAKAEIMPRFRSLAASDISTKSRPDDLVTAADLAAEAMITRALQIAFPDALVVGEEAAAKNPDIITNIADAPLAFILDPVDGTWNFAKGLALFGVILAVTQFGRPVFGLIYDPVADDWAIADNETPAALVRGSGTSTPLKVSMGKPVDALSGHIHLHHFTPEKQRLVAATMPTFRQSSPLRCSAHEYRLLAQGHVDFLLAATLNPWDHAAGVLICQQAGGHVEMLDGGPYSAGRQDGFLLAAPDRTTWNKLKKVFSFLLVNNTGEE
jgi:fructose-1,6-bisphosphatase/inositol monophosphatase family enzyme